jgi:hypothetical protein
VKFILDLFFSHIRSIRSYLLVDINHDMSSAKNINDIQVCVQGLSLLFNGFEHAVRFYVTLYRRRVLGIYF